MRKENPGCPIKGRNDLTYGYSPCQSFVGRTGPVLMSPLYWITKSIELSNCRSNHRYLYVLKGPTHNISAFAIQADETLVKTETFEGLPAHSVGITSW